MSVVPPVSTHLFMQYLVSSIMCIGLGEENVQGIDVICRLITGIYETELLPNYSLLISLGIDCYISKF